MGSNELRRKFLDFFEKRGHFILPSSSLIPTDPSVLFTTAGMQQFKDYFLGEPSPYGQNVATCQKCFRTSDIDKVGDETHLTFLEMLGNFSFGGYFKQEAIKLAYELLINNFQLSISQVTVTVFGGDREVPRDDESVKIWSQFGFSENKGNLRFAGKEDNFWGPTGLEGPCGPTTEIYINGVEVWNLVFNEYHQDREGNLTPLKKKGVDTGMGLERLAMIVQGKKNVFETDLFSSIINAISGSDKAKRIIADHIKGSVFLIADGILPSNVERGYVLRRILRRAIRYGKLSNQVKNFLIPLAREVMRIYEDVYPEVRSKEVDILTVIQNEEEKFETTLEKGLKELDRVISWWGEVKKISDKIAIPEFGTEDEIELGKKLFDIYQSYGIPLELALEEFEKLYKDNIFFKEGVIRSFQKEFQKHAEVSRSGAEKKFGGHGLTRDATGIAVQLHTATHLLHAALRQILGNHVKQMGSDITTERTRFDFTHPSKMTSEEIKKVEDLVNQKIQEDLEVTKEEMSFEEAIKSGALAFFKERYPEKVTVYSIGNFSKEICGGPHVKRTSELGHFKIIKEEGLGAGVRRIRAILE